MTDLTNNTSKNQNNLFVFLFVFLFVLLSSFFLLFSHNAHSSLHNSYDIGLKHFNEGDIAGAITIWGKLADSGDIKAQYSIGILYEQPGDTQSHQKAIEYLELASNQGMNKAQYHLAMKYFSGYGVEQDFNKTIQLLLKAAAQDFPEAQYQMGRMTSDGLGFKQDPTEAIRWYLLAAENGFGPAQHTLASHYMTGNGTATNVDKAVVWLKHASDQNNMLAQRDLGFLYTQGMGVDKDYAVAAELLNNPASQGSPVSQYLLGQIYAEGGNGLEKSIRSARYWFTEAQKSGYPKAEGALQQIAHIPSEPLPAEEPAQEEVVQTVVEKDADEERIKTEELANLVDPDAVTSEQQFYDFYNEDLSAYRTLDKQNGAKATTSIDEWAYAGGGGAMPLSEGTLVEYNDIDGQFDKAFASKAKSIGGRGNYKRLFGLAQSESDYKLRKERTYTPDFLSISESNEASNSKAVVFRAYSQSGEPQQLGFFGRKTKSDVQTAQTFRPETNQPKANQPKANQPKAARSDKTIQAVSTARVASAPVKDKRLTANKYLKQDESDLARFGKLSGENFTLQILQSTNPDKAKRISQNSSAKADNNLYVLPANRNNRPIYLVTYGVYPDRKKAEAAAKSLPLAVALGTPWIRKISNVQQQLQ